MNLLNAMGKAARVGGWAFDLETREGVWTDELYRIFELPVGQKPAIEDSILFYEKEDQCIIEEAYRKAIEHGAPYDLELRFITAKQNHIWVRTICLPEIENGKVKSLMGVFQDITNKKAAEEQRDVLEAELQQAMKMEAIGRLAGGVAHDFNNLLTVIKGYTELLISDLETDRPILNELMEIHKATQSAAYLAKQLLMFSRKQIINPKVLNLNDLINSILKMLKRLIGENISLQTELGEDLGAVKVDKSQFEQILANLVINARDAMPNGGTLTIETANIELVPDHGEFRGPQVMMEVRDTGHGMGEEVKKHLFEPFFTTKTIGHGTGLGLATIYGAVKQAGGNIEVYSEVDQGAAFKIYLPCVSQKPEWKNEQPVRPSVAKTGEETILLVEDEEMVRKVTVKALERFHYRVLHASEGDRAIEIAKEYQDTIHLLITDVLLPGINGRQLVDQLIKIRPEMKVLYISGYNDDVITQHGVVEKDINFIGKPYSASDLGKKVREVLDQ